MKTKPILTTLFSAFALVASAPIASAQGRPGSAGTQHAIHDNNNDGICDVCGNPVGSGRYDSQGQRAQNGGHYGPGDGTGTGSGPRDGTGYGAQSGQWSGPRDGSGYGARSGVCDGSGRNRPSTGQSGMRRGGRGGR